MLRAWKIGSTTVDGCDACGGVWLDDGELRALANLPGEPFEATEAEFTPGLSGGAGGGRRRCPVDREPLQPRRFRQATDIEVLSCAACGGLWLEEGELQTLGQLVPKHRGPLPLPDAPALGVTAVAGLMRTCHCPRCDAPNADLAERCLECGASLHGLPAAPTGNLLSSHPVRPLALLFELAVLAAVLLVLYGFEPSADSGALAARLPDGWSPLPAVLLAVFYVVHTLTRTWRVDATTQGLVFCHAIGRKFIPWDAIRVSAAFDLGSRAVWFPLVQFVTGIGVSRYRIGGAAARYGPDSDTPLSVLMFLYTSCGLVSIGPDLDREGELIERVMDHLDD